MCTPFQTLFWNSASGYPAFLPLSCCMNLFIFDTLEIPMILFEIQNTLKTMIFPFSFACFYFLVISVIPFNFIMMWTCKKLMMWTCKLWCHCPSTYCWQFSIFKHFHRKGSTNLKVTPILPAAISMLLFLLWQVLILKPPPWFFSLQISPLQLLWTFCFRSLLSPFRVHCQSFPKKAPICALFASFKHLTIFEAFFLNFTLCT